MDAGRFAQFATRFSRYRMSRRAALGTGGASLIAALLGRGAAPRSKAGGQIAPSRPSVVAWRRRRASHERSDPRASHRPGRRPALRSAAPRIPLATAAIPTSGTAPSRAAVLSASPADSP